MNTIITQINTGVLEMLAEVPWQRNRASIWEKNTQSLVATGQWWTDLATGFDFEESPEKEIPGNKLNETLKYKAFQMNHRGHFDIYYKTCLTFQV